MLGPTAPYVETEPPVPDADVETRLTALADAMVCEGAEEPSEIPAVMAFFAKFIEHDLVALVEGPSGRAGNLRTGALSLESLYGGALLQGDLAVAMQAALRFPGDPSKLWAGTGIEVGFGRLPIPRDAAADVLRLGRVIAAPGNPFTADEILALKEPLRSFFVTPDGALRVQRAIIGDGRNDRNLGLSQLTLALVRFHNKVAEVAPASLSGAEARFDWARREVTWIYQWLVLNHFLPAIAEPAIVALTLADHAPLYARFHREEAGSGVFPIPLEFSEAAFRFSHALLRDTYDWNRFFGRAESGVAPLLDRATLAELSAMSGWAEPPMPVPGQESAPRLPLNWPVEWTRLAAPVTPALPDRAANRIGTRVRREARDAARHRLRRGWRLGLPGGQAMAASVAAERRIEIPVLDRGRLVGGQAGSVVEAAGFLGETPLWYYILREAEVLGTGGRLGPLGSVLVAETLIGLVLSDPASYWHQPGSGPGGRWHPADGAQPAGRPVETLLDLFEAAGLQ